jgi:hypothetical protein
MPWQMLDYMNVNVSKFERLINSTYKSVFSRKAICMNGVLKNTQEPIGQRRGQKSFPSKTKYLSTHGKMGNFE